MSIVSHPANQKYRDNWDSIFKKKEERELTGLSHWVCKSCEEELFTPRYYVHVQCLTCGAQMEEVSR